MRRNSFGPCVRANIFLAARRAERHIADDEVCRRRGEMNGRVDVVDFGRASMISDPARQKRAKTAIDQNFTKSTPRRARTT